MSKLKIQIDSLSSHKKKVQYSRDIIGEKVNLNNESLPVAEKKKKAKENS